MRHFVAIFLCTATLLHAVSFTRINGKNYIALDSLAQEVDDLRYNWDALFLTAEIRYKKRDIRVQTGMPFFIADSKQYGLKEPAIYYRNRVFLSKELTEELISEFNIPVKYGFKKDRLVIKEDSSRPPPSAHARKTHLDFIVIDPGHGGKDPGALGPRKLREKDLVLQYSKILFRDLKKAFPKTRVYITRYNDNYLTLEERAQIANKKITRNDFGIFISVHANASITARSNGFEVYYLSQNSSNEHARQVMIRENGMTAGNSYIRKLEANLLRSQIQAESKVLARQLNKTLARKLTKKIKNRGVKKADFSVLRGVAMPAVLLEIGYVSNPAESGLLTKKSTMDAYSRGIIAGIKRFLKYRPKY